MVDVALGLVDGRDDWLVVGISCGRIEYCVR